MNDGVGVGKVLGRYAPAIMACLSRAMSVCTSWPTLLGSEFGHAHNEGPSNMLVSFAIGTMEILWGPSVVEDYY